MMCLGMDLYIISMFDGFILFTILETSLPQYCLSSIHSILSFCNSNQFFVKPSHSVL